MTHKMVNYVDVHQVARFKLSKTDGRLAYCWFEEVRGQMANSKCKTAAIFKACLLFLLMELYNEF